MATTTATSGKKILVEAAGSVVRETARGMIERIGGWSHGVEEGEIVSNRVIAEQAVAAEGTST